jgi:squalene-hopene/tetraprenyl-beta-curcumene cyclase
VRFLLETARPDGSWPIDVNLATWVTTLSVNALSALPGSRNPLTDADRRAIRDWLLGQQWTTEHPYTHAAPGGWAWTDLPGGVPDADDTPGALLALRNLGILDATVRQAAALGVRWLVGLQNPDGGIPTFCRGWGKLPFDRSSPDLTAHTLLAWKSWLPDLPQDLRRQVENAMGRATRYLIRAQQQDGSWAPLWFGNQHAPDEANRVYGTARVLAALDPASLPAQRGFRWLRNAQNEDGGWGGCQGAPSSIEETSLAVQALAQTSSREAIDRGVAWLVRSTDSGRKIEPAPIGLYFARLWYYEELYPLIFSIAALGHASP